MEGEKGQILKQLLSKGIRAVCSCAKRGQARGLSYEVYSGKMYSGKMYSDNLIRTVGDR